MVSIYFMLHFFKIHLWESCTCEKPPTCRQNDISSSESNLNILLPSIAKNTVWIPSSCVELIFQLKFTLLLMFQLTSIHRGVGWAMSFYVPFSSYQQICQGGESCRGILQYSHQVDPGHHLEMFSVPATVPPFSAAEIGIYERVLEELRTIGPLNTLV